MANNIFSKVFNNGVIVETIYNPVTQETNFVVAKDGESIVLESYKDDQGTEYLPISGSSDLLTKEFVRLPSALVSSEPVTRLYQEIRDFISQYMKLPNNNFLDVSATYVLLTWVFDCFNTLPYLRVIGTYGTGKSRFLQIMSRLCYKTMLAGGAITTAGVFRTADYVQGTLVMDEADYKMSEMWSEIIKIFNSGHTKGTPAVRMQTNKDKDFTTKTFTVYGSKILASRERFGDQALESRCLTAQLLPLNDLKLPIHLPPEFEIKSEELRNKLLAFRLYNYHKIKADENTLKGLSFPRLKQSALAITTVASYVSEEVLDSINLFLKEYENELNLDQRNDIKADVMECIIALVYRNQVITDENIEKKDKIYMLDISKEFDARYYNQYTDIPDKHSGDGVITYKSGAVSPKRIGTYIQKLGIRKSHDSKGFYIPLPQEIKTIEVLANRYGIERPWETDTQKNNTRLFLSEDKEMINSDDIPF